jgi:hypothetical protein
MFPKPDDFFKQAFEQWEKQTAAAWESTLRDPAFLKTMWQSMEMMLQARRQFTQASQETVASWQMPTGEKQEHIQQQLNRLQITLETLNQRVEELLARFDE